ncbi:(deoxy)nucleoside triphosphate pyrophosphohydrolase [Candidatus Micrarchaeota archaeon]|nr:(deoxy)nucleoside triphosphate pyrophosphohydrolase [Candidatus Micrarchaeota archaeon]
MIKIKQILVVAAIIRKQNRILICQRSNKDKNHPLKWEFPGGKVENEESPEQALQREMKEELGIKTEIGKIFGASTKTYEEYREGKVAKKRRIIILAYETKTTEIPKNQEFEEVKWEEIDKLEEYDFLDADKEFVKKLQNEKRGRKIRLIQNQNTYKDI